MSTIDPGSGTAVITVENTGGRCNGWREIKATRCCERVNTIHHGSGYSRVVLARKRTVPDYVKNVPTTPPVASIALGFPTVDRMRLESYSAINRRYACIPCAEIGIRPGAGTGDGWVNRPGYIACGEKTHGATRKEKITYILPSRITRALPVSV